MTTHGMFGTTTYSCWGRMIQRCTNPKNPKWKDYGGRGITVCPEWRLFSNFFRDMGAAPPGLSLDREKVNGNYEPGNCRWATIPEQNRNTRSNVFLEFNGKTQCLADWATEYGLDIRVLHKRLKYLGWPLESALTTPLRPKRK